MFLYKFYFSTPTGFEKYKINMKFFVSKNIATAPPPFFCGSILSRESQLNKLESTLPKDTFTQGKYVPIFLFAYLFFITAQTQIYTFWGSFNKGLSFSTPTNVPLPPPCPLKIMILTNLKIQYQKNVFSIKYYYKIQAPLDFNLSRRLPIWKIKYLWSSFTSGDSDLNNT